MNPRIAIGGAAVALLLSIAGCSSTHTLMVSGTEAEDVSTPLGDQWQKISGYTTAGAEYRPYRGWVRLASSGDTLEFKPESEPRQSAWVPDSSLPTFQAFQVPRDSIASVQAMRFSASRTALFSVALVVSVVAAAVAIAVATKESCPFIYSWDGTRYVFDGEPYGGATVRGLERTDWSELEHLVASHGKYRLLLTNEVDETQHTNRLSLLVVDHAPDATVVMSRDGTPHAFRCLEPLLDARDEGGNDLTAWLRDRDEVAWYPDLGAYSRRDSIADTRNHITLSFARPDGITSVYLICNAATGPWGSHMIRSMLGARGDRVGTFYAALNGPGPWLQRLRAWNEREELYELFPEVEQGDGTWARQDFIPGGGPFISESRAVPIDLRGARGDTIRIRIHPPIGYWRINSFHLAWDEAPVFTNELRPVAARTRGGRDVRALLAQDDDAYLDFPTPGDRATLEFRAPPARPGTARTIFAATRGWYEIHLHRQGPPDSAALARLEVEPGSAVRMALAEYAEYRRTGVLGGTDVRAEPAAR
ncbi:MAG: hypothetical protein ACM3JJ_06790 [Hyphomicrobiales bacterium]